MTEQGEEVRKMTSVSCRSPYEILTAILPHDGGDEELYVAVLLMRFIAEHDAAKLAEKYDGCRSPYEIPGRSFVFWASIFSFGRPLIKGCWVLTPRSLRRTPPGAKPTHDPQSPTSRSSIVFTVFPRKGGSKGSRDYCGGVS